MYSSQTCEGKRETHFTNIRTEWMDIKTNPVDIKGIIKILTNVDK